MNTIRNISLCAAFIIPVIWSSEVKGQKHIPYVSSSDSIELGVEYADTGAYVRAMQRYETVSENDTNYALALIEDAIAQEGDEEDSAAIASCRKGILLQSIYTSDFYATIANSDIDEGNYTDAISILKDTALVKYPRIHTLYYLLGLAHYKMHDYAGAIDAFEKAIDLDLYDANSHYYLGRCCIEQGRLVPALLSLQFYLLLQPDQNRSFTVIQQIEQLVENKYQYNKKYAANPGDYHDSAFMVIDPLIRSQIAMNSQYIETTNVHYKFVRQIQLLFEELKYVPNTGNYWMEKYVPLYTGIEQNNYFEPYVYFITASVAHNDESLKKGADKERKKINKFADWADKLLVAQRAKREVTVDGKKTTVDCEYWDNNMIESEGHKNSKGMYTGECTYYYRHNGALMRRANYNENGQPDGKWKWYYVSGVMKEEDNYVNGNREDTMKTWYENGAPKAIYIYHNDVLNGSALEYNNSGILTAKGAYKDGNITGATSIYYTDGKLHYTATYDDKGKLQGEIKEYYATGGVKVVKIMKDSKKEGAYTVYAWNGKVSESGQYKDDNQSGEWKWYYPDGSLQKAGNFNSKGNPEGRWTFYYRNGKMEETEMFNKDGKDEGTDSLYDEDGILYRVSVYKNGAPESNLFKDKNGNVIASAKSSGNTFNDIIYSPRGIKSAEGTYINDKREGAWKYYDFYGKQDAFANYSEDTLSGLDMDYFLNGKVKDSLYYKHGEKDGYYVSYYINGKMDIQGWYKDGNKEGDWLYYDVKGNLVKHNYYIGGDLYGHVDFFEDNGKLSERDVYKYGYIDKVYLYDSAEKISYTYTSDKGNGKFLSTYPNGNPLHEFNFVNGIFDGPSKRYYYDGKLSKECTYLMNDYQGADIGYYDNGKMRYNYTCDEDNYEDTARDYYPNGNLQQICEYEDDDRNGQEKYYYENGKLAYTCNYQDDELDGVYRAYYGEDMPAGLVWYKDGNIVAYASVGTDGQPVKHTELDSGTGQVVCYYPNGNKSVECGYYNGNVVGERINYAPDGKLISDENFDMGYRNGLQKYYYMGDTTLKEIDNYYYGDEDGISRYYYPDGKIEHDETYVLGTLEGPAHYYDENGNLVKTVYYYSGNEVSETKPEPKVKPKSKPKTAHSEKKKK